MSKLLDRTTLAAASLLAACTTQPPAPVAIREAGGESEALAQSPEPVGIVVPPTAGKRGPIPVAPLNIATRCAYEDEGGTQATMALDVQEAAVKRFVAQVSIADRGICRFDLKDFHQTAWLPAAVLSANQGQCAVRVWQQYERVTVAFMDCEAQCTGEAYKYLWPILADKRSGECS